MAAAAILKNRKNQLLVWRAIHYYVRTYENFLSYDSSDRAYIFFRAAISLTKIVFKSRHTVRYNTVD